MSPAGAWLPFGDYRMIQFSVVIGLLPRAGGLLVALKLIGVWLLVLLSSATVSQLIGREARLGKLQK